MRAWVAFLLLATGWPVAAGEICRFRALDPENPFRRWLASQEVTCADAGASLAFPPGSWNVFARAENAVSAAPLLIDGDAAPPDLAPELVPAATVAPLLPEGHPGVLYAPRRGSAFPVDGARVTVPADEPLWLFVLDASSPVPVALFPLAPLAPGTERSVDARGSGPASVVGWLQVPEPDRRALASASGVSAPAIRAGSRDADPLPPLPLLHGAFFLIRDAAAGSAELRVEGRGWVPDRRVVKVEPGLTVAAAPLRLRATGTLVVHWSTDADLPALDRSLGSCEPAGSAPRLVIAVSKCAPISSRGPAPNRGPERSRGPAFEEAECTPVREETVDRFFGNLAIEDVLPGLYRAEMRFGKLPPSSGLASVGPLGVGDLRVRAYLFPAHGNVTRGGEPLGEKVSLRFPGGIGFAPADSEEYHAVVRPPFLDVDAQIAVAACDGSPRAIVLADRPMRPNTHFDVDIPANELTVHVNDTFTREALPGASVQLEAMALVRPRVVFTTTERAGEQGSVVWSGVPVRTLRLTVSHPGYEKRTLEPFTMPESGTHTIDAQLVPLRGSRGRIVSSRPFEGGMVVWFSPAGSETERADLAPDGGFVYANRHTADETMAVVSASHPLWVLRALATGDRDAITLRFPDAPAAAFDVWLAASVPSNETHHVGIEIGGVRVPQPVLEQHQTLRRDPPLLRGAGPQHFRDLLATGPIDVLLGPTLRQRLKPGMTDVVFWSAAAKPPL